MKILVAEDNSINQLIFLRFFRKLGYEVDMASDGQEALTMVRTQNYDLIFLDIMMPNIDGIVATKFIRSLALTKQPVIIAITAFAEEDEKEACFKAGMNDYLPKPFTIEQLAGIITKWQTY